MVRGLAPAADAGIEADPEAALRAALACDPPDADLVHRLREALVRQWRPLALRLAKDRYNRVGGSVDDLQVAAVSALWVAALKVDLERWRFPTFAGWHIRSAMREIGPGYGLRVPRGTPAAGIPRLTAADLDRFAAPEKTDELDPDEVAALWRAVAAVLDDPRELQVIEARFRSGEPWRQIAPRFGVSATRAQQIAARAISRLRARGHELAGYLP
ncbi:sigma-70 family RNA polymerase sigma factor [bacterium]|nr:sigma-70 family RNA polymerase sigma factor [bacterium]